MVDFRPDDEDPQNSFHTIVGLAMIAAIMFGLGAAVYWYINH